MSINIKNREAEALLADLKRHTGKGTTDLLLDLLRREKARLEETVEARIQRGLQANRRLRDAWLAGQDGRPSVEDILVYDEHGLPM